MMQLWISILILIVLIILGVVAIIIKRKTKRPTDYYTLFMIGITWMAIGVPLKNFALSAMGIIFMIVGIVNKDKWKANRLRWNNLNDTERKFKLIIMIALGVLLLVGGVVFFLIQEGLIK